MPGNMLNLAVENIIFLLQNIMGSDNDDADNDSKI